jgi:hypothetical protein
MATISLECKQMAEMAGIVMDIVRRALSNIIGVAVNVEFRLTNASDNVR